MPTFQDIELVPGVNTELTLEANKAGISVAQLIRYKAGCVQKLGGWTQFYPTSVSSTPIRDVHAFQGLLGNKAIASASLTNVSIISSAGVLTVITPQINQTTPPLSLSVTSGSNVVTVVDAGAGAGTYSGVNFNIPVAIVSSEGSSLGGILLFGCYPINSEISSGSYTILSSNPSPITVSSGGTFPTFETTAGSGTVDVVLPFNQFTSEIGLFYNLLSSNVSLSIGGITLTKSYEITSIVDSTHFQISAGVQATGSSGPISPSDMSFTYFMCQGPAAAAAPYGAGNYSSGPYGIGVPAGQSSGTSITATDWVLDNWGEILIAVQNNGPIYTWAPDFNFAQMQAIYLGPMTNIGGFVSQPQQIMVAFGSVQYDGYRWTGAQDPLLINWSDSDNYTSWVPTPTNDAGSFHIPTGSTLVGGIQAPLFMVFWTDIDCWTAVWAGQPLIWSFTRVGTACGLLGMHAADVSGGNVYWASRNNFFMMGPSGVQVLPCNVWDFIFQNIDWNNASKVRAASNGMFNEISWFFPVAGGTGENTAYVKLHVGEGNEYEWDYGFLARTAWVDITVVGPPIGADNNGNLMQHETSFDAAGTAIDAYFETGYFAMGDGTEIAIVDWVIPDIRWQAGSQGSASTPGTLYFTFYTTDYPASTPPGDSGPQTGERVYGPFTVTQATQYINTRMRGRFWRCRIEGNDVGTFWRLGNIKFRWGPSGSR